MNAPALDPRPAGWFAVGLTREVSRGAEKRGVLCAAPYRIRRSAGGALLHEGSIGELREQNGFLMAWHHPRGEVAGFVIAWYDADGTTPSWHIPDAVFDDAGMVGGFVRSEFVFDVPPQVLNEDNFDVGHLYQWHQVTDVVTEPVEVDGPTISIAHRFKRHSILFGKPLPPPFDVLAREIVTRYSSTLHGHGLTASFIDIFNLGVRLQDLIWVTPIAHDRIRYTTFLRRARPARPAAGRAPWKRVADLALQPLIFRFSVWRLRREHALEGHGFWENQTPVASPILTEPERALIEPYRAWCRQFDPGAARRPAVRAVSSPDGCLTRAERRWLERERGWRLR